MPSTLDNLKEAFAGESQVNQKYRAFAIKAEKEGFPNIAQLFKTTAEAERIHAVGHLKSMDGIGSTQENLEAAIRGEVFEYTEMYPPMLEQAEAEGHRAQKYFSYAVQSEQVHAQLYRLALDAIEKGIDISESNIYLCPVCGHIEIGTPPEKCPICGVKAKTYTQIN